MSQVVYISVEPSHQTTVEGTTTNTWIHPHLNEATDATKGRQFRASHLIAQGACLLIDRPYAILPVVDDPASNDTLLCSNPTCNQPAPCHRGGRSPCPNACVADVVWCSAVCRDADAARHAFECTWLKRYAAPLRNKRSEYEFGILWLIVRLLATRQIEFHAQHAQHHNHPLSRDTSAANHRWKHGWAAIDALCGSVDSWSHDQVRSWMTLVKKYLPNSSVLPHGLTPDRVLHLVCQEEANSFGLYPRETGVFPLPDPPMGRGEQYAAAVYPTAAIMNHSCLPNVSEFLSSPKLIF